MTNASGANSRYLSVFTYNIHHGEGMDGEVNVERIGSVIASVTPDLVALQEVDRNCARSGEHDIAEELSAMLGMSYRFGKTLDLQGGEYGLTILSRFPILASELHLLPGGDEQRCVLEASVDTGGLAGIICFACIHTAFQDEEARVQQISELLDVFQERQEPILLAGDFNGERSDRSVCFLAEAGWEILDKGGMKTFPANAPEIEIDFVMLRGFGQVVTQSRVLDERVASDHRPVHTTIVFPPGC